MVVDVVDKAVDQNEELNQRADAAWHALAEQAGLDPAQYVQTRSWRKNEPDRARIVRLYEADGRKGIYLKLILVPEDIKSFQTQMMAQLHAADIMKNAGKCGVPSILAADLELRAFLMEEIEGDTVAELLDQGRNPDNMLRRSGRWMSAFHEAGFVEERVYQPKYMCDHIAHLLRQVNAGEKEIADFDEFETFAHIVMGNAENSKTR